MNGTRAEQIEKLLLLARRKLSLIMQLREGLSELCEKMAVEEIDGVEALMDRQRALAAEIDRADRDFLEARDGLGGDGALLSAGCAEAKTAPAALPRDLEELYRVLGEQREVLHSCGLLNETAVRQLKELQISVRKKLSGIRRKKAALKNYCPAESCGPGALLDIRVNKTTVS